MSVVVYLDDFDQPGNRDSCCPNEFRSQSSGVRVAIHDGRSPPDTTRGLAIGPGTETTVVVSEIDRQRLTEPYGNCTHTVRLGTSDDNIGYSLDVCQQLCHQNAVYASLIELQLTRMKRF
jgi:Amiloride-sensitive sodium channel